MPVNRLNKIVDLLLILAARLVSVTYADHPTAGGQVVSEASNSQVYLSIPPGR